MIGPHVRINRDGKWQSVDIFNLTSDEINQFAKDHPGDGWVWVGFLIGVIRGRGKQDQLDKSEQIGILRRIAERGLQHSQERLDSSQVDMWQHMLDEIGRL